VLPTPAAADPLPADSGVTARPRTVEAVQRRLAELGFLARSGVDGVFGAQSRGAVIAFQKWEGLVRDGIPGPVTQRALARAKRPEPLTRRRGTRIEILLDRQVLLFIRRGRVPPRTSPPEERASLRLRGGTRSSASVGMRGRSRYHVWLPYASYFVGGIAIHEAQSVPVEPASHGCVRATRYDARWLYRRAPIGTSVRVLARST
jgi:hypothetical protein